MSEENPIVNESTEVLRKCLICEQAEESIPTVPQFGPQWHDACVNCIECGKGPLDRQIVLNHIHKNSPLAHGSCWHQKMEREIMNREVKITQGHLDFLNEIKFRNIPNMELGDETNVQTAEIYAQKWLHETPVEVQFVALKMMQAVCAMTSIAIGKDRDRIQQERSRKEQKKHIEVDRIRKQPAIKAESDRVRLDPETKKKEKAIKAFMGIGYSREEALEHWSKSQQSAAPSGNVE